MRTSGFINNDTFEKTEILNTKSSTSLIYKLRKEGKLFFMKQLRPEFSNNERYREAFYKEFEAGKSISSPYVVKYSSIEENADGLYILMEYIHGVTLEEKLNSEPQYFSHEKNIKKLLKQLSQALGALHKQGIVHLDIKPENIMLAKNTNDVVLVDLGYCLTNNNDSTMGYTRLFCAPETLAGNTAEIDARSDIFSVGCILQYIEEKNDKGLSRALTNIKKRCLKNERTERFSSTEEIIDSIRTDRVKQGVFWGLGLLLTCLVLTISPTKQVYENIKNYIAWERGKIADRFEVDGIFYHITDDEACTVEVTFKGKHHKEFEYEYKGGEINVPQTITYKGRTFKVTAFAPRAFENPYISKVTIPEGIITIADSAFIYCNLNGDIYIPKSVEKIGEVAFVPALYIDSIVVDPENPFYDSRDGCNAIIETATNRLLATCNNTRIPDGVEQIVQNAFMGTITLKHLTLPASLKKIGEATFVRSGITEIAIPEGVTRIERYTFQYCENLQKVTLPQSLKSIGLGAFSHCSYSEIIIPDSVTFIDDYAFDCCDLLKTATIGHSVRHIGYGAFENCKRLEKVVSHIPADSLSELDNSVFNNISEKSVLYVPRGAKKVYENTFGWNKFDKIIESDL